MRLIERRSRRSPFAAPAVAFQLDYTRDMYGLQDLVLVSRDGLLMAFAGNSEDRAQWLAAVAPELTTESGPHWVDTELVRSEMPLSHQYFVCDGVGLQLIASTPPGETPECARALAHAERGLRRILQTAIDSPLQELQA